MRVEIEILGVSRSVFGINYMDGVEHQVSKNGSIIEKNYQEFGIGVGFICVYFIFYRGGN